MNHGNEREDNVTSEIKKSKGNSVILFYAKKDIKKDQELLFDYDGNG